MTLSNSPSVYYDALVIGAGHNGLTCACYLAKAGLKVLVLEDYKSIGGMTLTEEITLPGFKSDIHAFGYSLATVSPVPDELNLKSHGFELIYPEVSISHLFPNNHGYITMYKSLEKTLESIRKYSERDAQSWKKIFDEYMRNRDSIVSMINSPPINPLIEDSRSDSSEKKVTTEALEVVGDKYRHKTQSMRSWCNENFESDEVKALFGSFASFVGLSPDDAGGGELCYLFSSIMQDGGNNVVKGGFVNLPMALANYLQSKGGQIMTSSRVKKILIENGQAVGVELADGKIIGARKLIASSTDPSTLILNLIGEDYIDPHLAKSIRRMEWGDAIFGIYLALNGPLEYKSGQEILSKTPQIHISPPGLEFFSKIYYECRSGKPPSNPLSIMSNDSMMDPTRVVTNEKNFNQHHLIKFLVLSVPYKIKNVESETGKENEWESFKDMYADQIINTINQNYMPNLTNSVLRKTIYSPVDYEKKPINSIRGTLASGAILPYQSGWMRPVPQLSNYKVPSVSNVYLCGSASHPGPGVSMAPGRNAARVILQDLGIDLRNIFAML
ncbi:Phytoene desaturase (Neurosporene-forming) [Candidatus Nitrosocosmicus franklandus]|uniref:Pyridine nucleotide-disulfide oxidoreductase domain-containing protein 2 n=1 Tax=Candidatus Nitrosocosmicus franklandianus TaxID=1798806 RepID=A0A484IEZ2_9ARCH|nr:Phytoene desaturase (Neurosporene-forming) [Candidatus Nitrosocosmicus franklandus]